MFSKRKSLKKIVNFDKTTVSDNNESVSPDECVPGFYFGSAGSISTSSNNNNNNLPPLPWQHQQQSSGYSHEEIDKIITPHDRFESLLSDNTVISSASGSGSYSDSNDTSSRKPEIFVPIDSHHFDEDDYRNHRHRVYPHMHQPLKSMEPRVLRKIKQKIRDNKRAQMRAATAGVPTCVPQLLLASASSDSRVLIGASRAVRAVSGPVVRVEREEGLEPEESSEPVGTVETSETIDTGSTAATAGKKKKKRKRRRSKKQEPFQPTLGKLSEESSSPINSGNEREFLLGFGADLEEEFEEEFEDDGDGTEEGLVLEELCAVVSADKAIEDVMMEDEEKEIVLQFQTPRESIKEPEEKLIPFLEEIASTDPPIGFLDLTLQTKNIRKHSLPVFVDSGHLEEKVDLITSQSSADLIHSKTSHKRLQFDSSVDYSDGHKPLSTAMPLPIDLGNDDVVDDLRSTSTSLVALTSTTQPHPDLNQSSLTQVASTSALTSESCIKLSNCNFHIGSIDNVSKHNVFNLQSILPSNPSINEVPESYSKPKPSPHHSHHHHHHYHHHKEHFNKRDLEKRTFSGQDMRSLWQSNDQDELDEFQSMLGDAIIDDMRSHRCYDMPALNRTRIRNKYSHSIHEKKPIQRSRSESHSQNTVDKLNMSQEKVRKCTTCSEDNHQSSSYTKSQQDLIFQNNAFHNECNCSDAAFEDPLPLFVEMDILKSHTHWRESSRWVKYEQCYNECSETFGRAHNSPLKFTAFTQFRVQMEDALFMPNVEVKSLSEAVNQLVEQLLVSQLFTELRDSYYVKEVFRLKHLHPGEKIGYEMDDGFSPQSDAVHASDCSANMLHTSDNNDFNLRVINTTPGNLNNAVSSNSFAYNMSRNKTETGALKSADPLSGIKYYQHSNFPSMIKLLKNSIPILRHSKQYKSDLEGHLPTNTEGVTVQVGELTKLKKPFLAIMRFKTPLFMDKVTELNVPIRFMIVCLGPIGRVKYEELGRVISTMMINKDFRRMMYRATDKYEIIEGLYKYLDTCFVLSYSGPHPTRNIHTMLDHINDFSRLPGNISPLRSVSKDHESIKHSASVNWADEQHSQLVKRMDHQRSHDLEMGGDRQVSYKKIDYESDKDKLPSSSKGDAFIIYSEKLEEDVCDTRLKKVLKSNTRVCDSILFFLFRLLRLDLINYKKRFTSDFLDVFKKDNIVLVLCGLLYLYFVCLSPALTFGALLGELVSDTFSVQLVLASQGTLLILFALLGGNPLLVIGITGPMFLMETVIGKMADSFKVSILLYRFIIAIYCTVIGILSLAFNITWIMQKVRRSVEECFNGFVGLYFIFKSILTIVKIFSISEPLMLNANITSFNSSEPFNNSRYLYTNRIPIGLASIVMAYSMYQICIALNGVKRGRFFTRKIRKMVDYFNVAIGILVLSLINVVFFNILNIKLPTLKADSNNNHWIMLPPFREISSSMTIAAHMIAFLLAFALLSLNFTETAISGITVTRQDRKLVKPSLFAQDQFMCLCVIPLLSGLLGWPFVSGAAVRSTSHVIAMTKWDQKVIPGVRHKILGVVEQRFTILIVGGLLLATVSVEFLLNYIPKSAMLGMFLYMGVMGIRDLVVTRRLIAMFKRRKHWKDHEYLRDIPTSVLKAFEILQLGMIALMFSMNCITEFTGISWCSFLIPVLLLLFAVCRELVLPRISWFEHHLDKLDPRHLIQIANISLSNYHCDNRSVSDKSPAITNRPVSVNSGIPGSNLASYNRDSQSDIDDSIDTSGNEVSSCTSSDQE